MNESHSEAATPPLALVGGTVLVVLGVGGYALSGFASVTALIPAIFGAVIVGLGLLARRSDRQRLAVVGVGALALLGVLGSLRGLPDLLTLLGGGEVDSIVAPVAMGGTVLVGVVLLGAVVFDFVGDRI